MKYKLITSATLPGREQVVEQSRIEEKLQITFFSLLVFASAIPWTQVINIGGELYVTELLLPVLAAIVLLMGKSHVFREKVFWQFVSLGICLMFGYIVSDLVAGTDSSNYIRAWGRNVLLFIDFIALAIIVGSDRRLVWWFVLGTVTNSLFFFVFGDVSLQDWKLGYAQPLTLMVLLLTYFIPLRVALVVLIALSVISIYMDSRSSSAFSLFVAGFIIIRIKKPAGLKLSFPAVFKIATVGSVLIMLIMTLLSQTQGEFSDRRDVSSSSRLTALRVGVVAIGDSPILGHGSWGEGTEEYADMVYEDMKKKMAELGRDYHKGEIFRPHSQIIQSWMEGGLFAAAFFIFLGYQLIIGLKEVVLSRQLDYLSPLYVFLLLSSIWHLLLSPYGGGHRLQIAMGIMVICLLYVEKRKIQDV